MGKWKVAIFFGLIIITLIASFAFSNGIFINHCFANKPKTKERAKIKTVIKNRMVEKYIFGYKEQMVKLFGARVK